MIWVLACVLVFCVLVTVALWIASEYRLEVELQRAAERIIAMASNGGVSEEEALRAAVDRLYDLVPEEHRLNFNKEYLASMVERTQSLMDVYSDTRGKT